MNAAGSALGQHGTRSACQFHALNTAQDLVSFFELTHTGNDGANAPLGHQFDSLGQLLSGAIPGAGRPSRPPGVDLLDRGLSRRGRGTRLRPHPPRGPTILRPARRVQRVRCGSIRIRLVHRKTSPSLVWSITHLFSTITIGWLVRPSTPTCIHRPLPRHRRCPHAVKESKKCQRLYLHTGECHE